MRIGILNDLADAPPSPSDMEQWLRLIVDEYIACGRIRCDVDFVNAWGLGLPSGTASAVERAYQSLVAQDVQIIVGPAVGDNAIIATPLAERYRVPTINWAGSEKARSDYMFHLQVGSHEDESIVLARYLAFIDARRVGVIYDDSPIGHGHLEFFCIEAKIVGLDIVAVAEIAPTAETTTAEVATMLAAKIDALVYLGLGVSASAVAQAAREQGWEGHRAMNSAGIRGHMAGFSRAIDGWVYVDLFSDQNTTLANFYRRVQLIARNKLAAGKGYDLARLVAEAIARALEPTREGIRNALEHVKWLPSAQGHEGTLLGFGKFDRAALHGRYLVLRQWRNGCSVEIM